MKTDPTVCVEVFREKKPYATRLVCFALACFFSYLGYLSDKSHNEDFIGISVGLLLVLLALISFFIAFAIGGQWVRSVYECSVCKGRQRSGSHCEICGAEAGKPFVPKQ
jgi:hypothetical protein